MSHVTSVGKEGLLRGRSVEEQAARGRAPLSYTSLGVFRMLRKLFEIVARGSKQPGRASFSRQGRSSQWHRMTGAGITKTRVPH